MAPVLFVHDHRRCVQESAATGRRVPRAVEGRHDGRQFRWSGPRTGRGTVIGSADVSSVLFADPFIPMFYYVTKENVDYEKADPGSQLRTAGPEYENSHEDPPLFLWNQALYVIAQLLTSNLLHINELDPIRRYLPSYNRPKRPGRYSAFQVPS